MDPGWDIPQSGSGAGSSQTESSNYQDSNAWDLSYPPDAYENSSIQHDTFWGAEPQAFNVTYDDEVFGTYDNSTFASDLKPGEIMNAKYPPTYDQSTMTWFMFEEYVKDWEKFTVVEPAKRGPLLRNRLRGYPATFKRIFKNFSARIIGVTGML